MFGWFGDAFEETFFVAEGDGVGEGDVGFGDGGAECC